MKPLHIGLVKMSALGDILQVAFVIRHLKKYQPDIIITWVVEKKFQDLIEALDLVDDICPFEGSLLKKSFLLSVQELYCVYKHLKKRPIDYLIDFQGNCKSGLIDLLCRSKNKVGFDKNAVAEFPNLLATNIQVPVKSCSSAIVQYFTLVKTIFPNIPDMSICEKKIAFINPRIMVCFGSNWINKTLSFDQLERFLDQIHKRYQPEFFLAVGSEKDLEEAKGIQKLFSKVEILYKPSWKQWIHSMKTMDFVVSADSCALHLAGFLDIPSFSYFGPSSARVYKPLGSFHHSFQGECPYKKAWIKRCPLLRSCKTGACLKMASSEELFQAFATFVSAISSQNLDAAPSAR